MSFKALFTSLPLLWTCTTALPAPAGPGYWANGTITHTSEVHASSVYSLVETYDASNWISKFNVQAVSHFDSG